MASKDLESLYNIFNGRFLRIPDYQRGYAWGEQQLKDFWEDLECLEDKHIHYFGVLTVEKVTQQKKEEKRSDWEQDRGAYESDDVYYIVDGQQRITTSIILIYVLLEKAKKEGVAGYDNRKIDKLFEKFISEVNLNGIPQYYFGYTRDNPSYEFLKTKIYGDKSSSNNNEETLYTANLESAKKYFQDKIKDIDIKQVEILFKKITKSFKFNLYEISDDFDVYVAFETMNNRGKGLSNLELLKNRLIYLSTRFQDDDKTTLREEINNCWKTIYGYLGKNKDKLLDDDKFLKNHWIMYHDYSRKKGNDYIIDLLEERYTAKRVISGELTIKEIREYILSLKDSVEHWYYLHNPEQAPYNNKIKFWLDKLYRLNYGAFMPLLLAIFNKDDYDSTDVVELLQIMERYIFIIFRVSQRRSNTGDSEFYGYARAYLKGDIDIKGIIGEEDIKNDEYSGINWWLASYIDITQFKNYLKEKFEKREGYYSWNGLNYFLFEYELSLKGKNYENKIIWSEYQNRKADYVSIEHILPQTIEYECWEKEVEGMDDKQRKKLCNSLGNLVPLSSPKNSSLQNYCFDVKKNGKKEKNMVGYKNGSYSEQEINAEEKWGREEILNRGIKLLDFMARNWNIGELEDDEVKKEYLFLVS